MTIESTIPAEEESHEQPAATNPTTNQAGHEDADESGGIRRFLGGAAGALLGFAGLSAVTDSANAASNEKELVVLGTGPGKHTYEISMKSGGSIRKAGMAGGNDRTKTTSRGIEEVVGEVWHWRADSYTFTGEIEYVLAEAPLSLHFPKGAFTPSTREVTVMGMNNGTHKYALGSNNADINPVSGSTEWKDSDQGKNRTEKSHTPDWVTGHLVDNGTDKFTIGSQPLQHIEAREGKITVS